MLLVNDFKNLGDLAGTILDFAKAGDMLNKHNHDENTIHITIVARGTVKISSHDWEKVATAGQIIDFCPFEPHQFEALEDNTRLINVLKKHGGVSNDYNQE